MSAEAQTKPSLETLSKQLENLRARRCSAASPALNYMPEQMDIPLDHPDGLASKAHSLVMFPGAGFKEFRAQFRETAW